MSPDALHHAAGIAAEIVFALGVAPAVAGAITYWICTR